MAGPYYCDLGNGTFADATGLDSAGNEYTGPAGLQAGIRGTGNATIVGTGEVLYCKGTGDLTRYIEIDCNGTDVSGWGINDNVRNFDGGGDDWTGVVVETSSAGYLATTDLVRIWLASGKDETDVNVADGIENTDAGGGAADPTSVDPIASVDTPGINIDTTPGSDTAKNPLLEGVTSAWAVAPAGGAGNSTAYQSVLDGGSLANRCLWTSNGIDYRAITNFTFQNSAADGVDAGSAAYYWDFYHCLFQDNTIMGHDGASFTRTNIDHCIYRNNGSQGTYAGGSNNISFCIFAGNGLEGYFTGSAGNKLVHCLSYDNLAENFQIGYRCALMNSIADCSGANDGVYIGVGYYAVVMFCRITSNNDYGISVVASRTTAFVDYCVTYNNVLGNQTTLFTDGGNNDFNPADSGYTDVTYYFNYDGELNGPFQVGEEITTVGGKSGTITVLVDNGATGTITFDQESGGMFANNDAITGQDSGATANVNLASHVVANPDYSLKSGSEIRSSPLVINWDGA